MVIYTSKLVAKFLEWFDKLMFNRQLAPPKVYSPHFDFSAYSYMSYKFLLITHFLPLLWAFIIMIQDDYQRWCIHKWTKGKVIPKDYNESIALYYALRENSDNEYFDYYDAKWKAFIKKYFPDDVYALHALLDNLWFDLFGRRFAFKWEYAYYQREIKIFGFVWQKKASYDFSDTSIVNRTRIECKASGRCRPGCQLLAYDDKGVLITKYDGPYSTNPVLDRKIRFALRMMAKYNKDREKRLAKLKAKAEIAAAEAKGIFSKEKIIDTNRLKNRRKTRPVNRLVILSKSIRKLNKLEKTLANQFSLLTRLIADQKKLKDN